MPDIRYLITVDAKGAVTNIKEFDSTLQDLKTTGERKTGPALSSLWKQMAIGTLVADGVKKGVKFLAGELKDTVGAAAAQELAERNLADAFSITGRNVDDLMPKFKTFSEEIQKETTYTDDAVLAASALIAQLSDLDEQGLKQATRSAIGMASVFKVDLQSAATSVAKAMAGNYDMLARYLPQLRTLKTEEEKHAFVTREMGNWYKRAQGEIETFSGSLKQLDSMYDEVKESIGRAITENENIRKAIHRVRDAIIELVESGKLERWVDNIANAFSTILPPAVEATLNAIDRLGRKVTDSINLYELFKGKIKGDDEALYELGKRMTGLDKTFIGHDVKLQDVAKSSGEAAKQTKTLAEELNLMTQVKATETLNKMRRALVEYKDKLTPEAEKKLRQAIQDLEKACDPRAVNAFENLGDAGKEAASDLDWAWKTAMGNVRQNTDRDSYESVLAMVNNFEWGGGKIEETVEKTTRESKHYFDGLYNDIARGMADVVSSIKLGNEGLEIDFKKLFGTILDAFKTMIGEMVAGEILDKFLGFFKKVKKGAEEAMEGAAKGAVGAVGEITKGASGAISGLWTGLGAAVGTFLGTVLAGVFGGGPSGHQQEQQINDTKDSRNFLAEIRNWLVSVGMNIEHHIVGLHNERHDQTMAKFDALKGAVNKTIPILQDIRTYTSKLKNIVTAQQGLDMTIHRPTLVMAGEAGPERLRITPQRAMAAPEYRGGMRAEPPPAVYVYIGSEKLDSRVVKVFRRSADIGRLPQPKKWR